MSPALASLRQQLKIRQLLLLDALSRATSLRKAASLIGMAQPAATLALAELEALLGVPLFERTRRGMRPTLFGESMMTHARSVLACIDRAQDDMTELMSGSGGLVRIGTIVPATVDLLPRCIAEIKQRFPTLRMQIEQLAYEPLLAGLSTGRFDLVIGREAPQQNSPEFEQITLFQDPYVVVAAPGHPLAKSTRLSLAAVVDLPWIMPPEGPQSSRLVSLFQAQAGRVPATYIESLSLPCNLALIRDHGFVSVMGKALAQASEKQGAVSILNLQIGNLLGPVMLLSRRQAQHLPAVEHTRDALIRLARAVH